MFKWPCERQQLTVPNRGQEWHIPFSPFSLFLPPPKNSAVAQVQLVTLLCLHCFENVSPANSHALTLYRAVAFTSTSPSTYTATATLSRQAVNRTCAGPTRCNGLIWYTSSVHPVGREASAQGRGQCRAAQCAATRPPRIYRAKPASQRRGLDTTRCKGPKALPHQSVGTERT